MHQLIGWSFLLFTLSPSVYCDFGATLRQTSNGPVEGTERISSLGQKYYSFIGIPYAEPPITGSDPYTGEHVDRRFKVLFPLLPNPFKTDQFTYSAMNRYFNRLPNHSSENGRNHYQFIIQKKNAFKMALELKTV